MHFEDIGHLASVVSKDELLRNSLLPLQHACIKKPGLIANGRDMGTKVFPNSMLKLYFIADIEIRAKRRYDQLVKNGSDSKLEDIRKSLAYPLFSSIISPIDPSFDIFSNKIIFTLYQG